MRDFQWRKSMDMNVRRPRPHGAQYIEIGIAVIGRVNAALKAYLRRAALHRFRRAAPDFLNIQTIDPKTTRLHSSHSCASRMPSAAWTKNQTIKNKVYAA